jgi:glycogen debranching enzyme
MITRITLLTLFVVMLQTNCSDKNNGHHSELTDRILEDERLDIVLDKAKQTLMPADGQFKAGSNYPETWIRDFATFIEIALEVNPREVIKERILLFFDFQGEDGNIPDGYTEVDVDAGYDYIFSETAPDYKAHKNTVETDQESSLILAIARYIKSTGDRQILMEEKNGKTVLERCEMALDFLKHHRYSDEYGLLIGATTIDWTDVQPESPWGVFITEDTHWCIDVYDNAIYILAIDAYLEWIRDNPEQLELWAKEKKAIAANVKRHLWDEKRQKFIPHLYLEDSPFTGFDENEIFYLGGTVYAILAGILNEKEISASFNKMLEIKKISGSMTIAIINYPPYPEGSFHNDAGTKPYVYVNAADWTWWGGRTIEAMIATGHLDMAYQEISPFLDRVIKNNGFYEWYSVIDHQPHGSNTFLGAAGALGKAIYLLKNEAEKYQAP